MLAACGSDASIVTSSGGGDGVASQPDTGGSDSGGDSPGEDPVSEPVADDAPDSSDDLDDTDDREPVDPEPAQPEEQPVEPIDPDEGTVDPDTTVTSPPLAEPEPDQPPADAGWQRIEPMLDLLDPSPAQPDELLIAPDGRTVLVRFWNGVEPCSGARVTVTELGDTVEVVLETGANPNAATMTCIALAAAYEIAVPLAEPLGDRQLVALVPAGGEPPANDPLDGAVFGTEQYLGLTLEEAEALAEVEQRPFRIGRIDDEFFALTEDYRPERVTVDIEAGVVVAAISG